MLDKGSELILELILAKTAGTLTEEDVNFLVARRSYVTRQQFELLGIDLDAELARRSGVKQEEKREVETEKKPLSKMTKAELLEEAKTRGVTVAEDATNDEIREALK